MALTPSTMLPLGTPAPDFVLPDTDGKTVALNDLRDKQVLVVAFICNHCPYVKHLAPAMAQLGKDYANKSVAIVAISANDVADYPDDSPEKMKEEKAARGYNFPYLYDESQAVAQAYTAACTPDFFVFGPDRKLVYRGQFDDSRPTRISSGNYDSTANQPSGADVRAAVDAVLAGQPVSAAQQPSIGCNIKWKAGNAPQA